MRLMDHKCIDGSRPVNCSLGEFRAARAQLEAMIAAQKAVAVVSATAQKTDQILVKQEATQQRRTA